MAGRHGFEPGESRTDLGTLSVSLRERDSGLRACAQGGFGLPLRPRRPPAVWLRPGQWLRRQLNHRFGSASGMADRSYSLDTFTVAHGPVERDGFLGKRPCWSTSAGRCDSPAALARASSGRRHPVR
ncbi:hypothetical protein ABT288_07750 [Streptomyces sp. NPDC001093]|uniref:hypothetical protein n=1 Tax=Streptomyces sp. NPDC001093 TaxID=3154376 RepID=UPI003324AFD6